jgi:hypothetical protein
LGVTQLALVVHALKHELPLHVYGAHGSESGGAHSPVALHVDGGVYTLPEHVSGAHTVPGAYF